MAKKLVETGYGFDWVEDTDDFEQFTRDLEFGEASAAGGEEVTAAGHNDFHATVRHRGRFAQFVPKEKAKP